MVCDICGKTPSLKAPFHCPACARGAIYSLRIEHASTLVDKEAMGRRIEAVVQGNGSKIPRESLSLSGKIIDTHDCAKANEMEAIMSDSIALSERLKLVSNQAKSLRSEMEEYRKSIKAKKAAVSRRRSDAESATYGLRARESKELEGVEASIRRTRRRWEMKHDDIVAGRSSLCRDGHIREYYTIGSNLPVFDLRELHSTLQTDFCKHELTLN